ncbi:polysaccharide deacetylase family protein [Photobacterium leiognathi]|uniref:polysaccharide deacetylase family protein n=1 Tax=Photobacterium leiognathi TaxID=553611 RepID=UPI00298166BD|nr:polysaccharide deacetylase family protein [Photobacterium leiognathi]
MSSKSFIQLCEDLNNLGFEFKNSIGEVATKDFSNKNMVHFTFDDGYSDNFNCAHEILERYNSKATVYIVTDFINGTLNKGENGLSNLLPLINKEVISLYKSGWNIGFHTARHINLYNESNELIYEDFKKGFYDFNTLLAEYPQKELSFAYPFGALPHDQNIFEEILLEKGFDYAVTTKWGTTSSCVDDRFYINRVLIGDSDNRFWILLKISGLINWYAHLKWNGDLYERKIGKSRVR